MKFGSNDSNLNKQGLIMADKLPKIAIAGYGAMGKEIEKLAGEQNIEIAGIFDIDNKLSRSEDYDFDVAIDFSLPEAVIENIEILADKGKSIVVGTTGWYDKMDYVKKIVEDSGIGLVYGSNFSLGMNMFFRIIGEAAKLMSKVDGYDIFMHEIHHIRKKDSPSGSATTLAEIIMNEIKNKTKMQTEAVHRRIEEGELHVSSTRGGNVTGTHTVYLDSAADILELTHRARNRSGFAMGSLLAAKWIHGKKGFHVFSNVLEDIWD